MLIHDDDVIGPKDEIVFRLFFDQNGVSVHHNDFLAQRCCSDDFDPGNLFSRIVATCPGKFGTDRGVFIGRKIIFAGPHNVSQDGDGRWTGTEGGSSLWADKFVVDSYDDCGFGEIRGLKLLARLLGQFDAGVARRFHQAKIGHLNLSGYSDPLLHSLLFILPNLKT